MKKIILVALAFCLAIYANAQITVIPAGSGTIDKVEALFNSPKDELDINFKIVVSKEVVMHFAMTRIGLWQGKEAFKKHLSIAGAQLKLYEDSMKPYANSKRLDINIGVGDNVLSRYTTSTLNNDIRMEKDGRLDALKMAKDSLRMLIEYENRKHQSVLMAERVQYTFEIKELAGFLPKIKEGVWVERAAEMIDSVVTIYTNKWHNPDAEYHTLYVHAPSLDSTSAMQIRKRPLNEMNKGLGVFAINGGYGISLVRNTLCPNVNFGMQYNFRSADDMVPFVKLSMNTFMRFEEKADKRFQAYSTGFVNAELGFQSDNQNKQNKNFLLSLGFGYMLTTYEKLSRDPSMDKRMYKMFFNYSLSNNIILQPEFITNFGRKEKENGWIGITVNFQLF